MTSSVESGSPSDDSSYVDFSSGSHSMAHAAQTGLSSTSAGPKTLTDSLVEAEVGSFLAELLQATVIHPVEWANLPAAARESLSQLIGLPLLDALIAHKLLTPYQAEYLKHGQANDLLLGNYRILDRIGAGGNGVVYLAQHVRLRRPVAIKVLVQTHDLDARALPRFFAEMEAIGQLRHPNIVAALDAGEVAVRDHAGSVLHYLVMEYVPGQDLAAYVVAHGPIPPPEACQLIHQVASALAEAHRQQLIHRDVKPSNILITPEKQAKLLDFGLARRFGSSLTEPGIPMGTLDYMSPEQVRDSSSVDARADVYGLGGTLYWCLAGRPPFPTQGSAAEKMMRRLTQSAPPIRTVRPEVPAELEAVIARMLALKPDDRYPTMDSAVRALSPFLLTTEGNRSLPRISNAGTAAVTIGTPAPGDRKQRILVVDDDPLMARIGQRALERDGWTCDRTDSAENALALINEGSYDLILLDVQLPGLSGLDLLKQLRQTPPSPYLKIVMCSGIADADEMAQMMLAGADDYLTKPVSPVQLQARARAALLLKQAQDHSEILTRQLRSANAGLESDLSSRDSDLLHARNALVVALAKLVEYRTMSTERRLQRLQRFTRTLAEAAVADFPTEIDQEFVLLLECCVPLHDIGKVGLPDHILLKAGKLEHEERLVMRMHTTIGADTLDEVARRYPSARSFLRMAIVIARHHHEHYDGNGYPDRLAGTAIPLAGRLVALADVYDALRSRRPYRPGFPHRTALEIMLTSSPGHFDPVLVQVFTRCAERFEQIYDELPDAV